VHFHHNLLYFVRVGFAQSKLAFLQPAHTQVLPEFSKRKRSNPSLPIPFQKPIFPHHSQAHTKHRFCNLKQIPAGFVFRLTAENELDIRLFLENIMILFIGTIVKIFLAKIRPGVAFEKSN
jgi:hypothetical protein